MTDLKCHPTLQQLLADFVGNATIPHCKVTDITNDSRLVTPGSLFIACPGLIKDGRDFIPQAIRKNAVAVCYQADLSKEFIFNTSIPIIPVSDLVRRQGIIASRFYHHPTRAMTVAGVTGTNGKTSFTHFLAEALALRMRCAVMGTLGYGFLPNLQESNLTTADAITLQKRFAFLRERGAEAVAMEVSSHALDQHRVVGIDFDYAIYTQLSRDHLDYHGDMQTYAAVKALLFQQRGLQHGVINIDNEFGRCLVDDYSSILPLVTYSMEGRVIPKLPSITVKRMEPIPKGFQVSVVTPWGKGNFIAPLLGRFNVSNLLAVLAVLGLMDIPLSDSFDRLSCVGTVPGRMEQYGGGELPTVVIDYSHTPDALEKTLLALREHCAGKLWCVFGCGGDRDRGKRPEMGSIAERLADIIVITNDNPRFETPEQIASEICMGLIKPDNIKIELNRAAAIKYVVQSAEVNDIVLVAGKGHETYQQIKGKILPFSDKQQVEEQLRLRRRKD